MKIFREEKGSTLLELIVVMGIIVILSAIGINSYFQYVSRARVKTAINNLIILKKALNNMATVCQGFPMREDPSDMNEILPIIDLTECKGSTVAEDAKNPPVFPTEMGCPQESLGDEILKAYSKTTLTESTHSSSLCRSTCKIDNIGCQAGRETNFHQMFVTAPEESSGGCSPDYGSPAGSEYASIDGTYKPGWNYALLHDANNSIDKPVGVICGVAPGYKTAVKIVINTAGYFSSTSVEEGSAIFDINGNKLPGGGCPCGAWCQEITYNRYGCCTSCQNKKGIGYRY